MGNAWAILSYLTTLLTHIASVAVPAFVLPATFTLKVCVWAFCGLSILCSVALS